MVQHHPRFVPSRHKTLTTARDRISAAPHRAQVGGPRGFGGDVLDDVDRLRSPDSRAWRSPVANGE